MAKHRIVLIPLDAQPIYSGPNLAGPKQRVLKRKKVAQMKKASRAEPAVSKWALPIVFVTKKNGSLRFYVDYRRLNAVTVRGSYHS